VWNYVPGKGISESLVWAIESEKNEKEGEKEAKRVAMKCSRCGQEMSEGNSYTHLGETLCEDCYLDIRFEVKTCDPWAVYSATRSRESANLKGTEGLTDLQKEIYALVKRKGKVTREEVIQELSLSEQEMQTQLATLRHCELVKGHKEGDKVYLVPFS
jgi:late competence protein required for DNA uptake (superfamily II DNA/RNA helicase)